MATEPLPESSDPSNKQIMEAFNGLQSRVERLEEENEELREENEFLKNNYVTLNAFQSQINVLLSSLTGAEIDATEDPVLHKDFVEDFNSRVCELETAVAKQEDTISNLGEGKSSGPEEAWHNIVQAAQRLAGSRENGLPSNRVRLYIDNISQATGKSERQASNYIDRFGGEGGKKGAQKRDYEPATAQNGNEAKRKSLVVSLDVWGDDDE